MINSIKNTKTYHRSFNVVMYLKRLSLELRKLGVLNFVTISLYLLTGCTTTTYSYEKINGKNAAILGCAVMRYNGSFSPYGSRIDSSIRPENARGFFIKEGTHVTVENTEASWDFENGYRVRVYIKVPVRDHWQSFFLEKMFDKKFGKDKMIDFVYSFFTPCER